MAESLDDGEFWLPSQFLTDDDMFMDKKRNNNFDTLKHGIACETDCFKNFLPFEFCPFGVSSDLSSPVDSVIGSTEESDEEDYIAGLTCKMARSTLGNEKDGVLSGSPQSTLCGVGNGCRCSPGSSRGSPNGLCKASSPPATWDLLHAAAGEVAKIRMNQQERYDCYNSNYYGFNKGLLGPPRKPSPISVPLKSSNPDFGFYNNPQLSLSYQKLQASQFQLLRQQLMLKQQQQQQRNNDIWGRQPQQQAQPVVQRGRNHGTTLGLSASAWPTLQQVQQQRQNQGMRAVFLGNPGSKRECAGTGVFLPRCVGNPTESRKKPACSTVLLPARVVQALNLNLEDMGGSQSRFNASLVPDTENLQRFRNSNAVSHQKRSLMPQQEINCELRLPQEWTY